MSRRIRGVAGAREAGHLLAHGRTGPVARSYHLDQVSDVDLLTNTRRLVGRSNQLLAALLVPDRIEPLGPEPVGIPMPSAPTWRKLVESFAAGGRELPPGDRPKDWVDSAEGVSPTLDREDRHDGEPCERIHSDSTAGDGALADERYLIQFTVSQEYTDLLERAQDLLSHAVPNRSLEEVHLRALRLLVEQLEKRKYGAPRKETAGKTHDVEAYPTGCTFGKLGVRNHGCVP